MKRYRLNLKRLNAIYYLTWFSKEEGDTLVWPKQQRRGISLPLAVFNPPVDCWLPSGKLTFPWKMVIFHSYVNVYQRVYGAVLCNILWIVPWLDTLGTKQFFKGRCNVGEGGALIQLPPWLHRQANQEIRATSNGWPINLPTTSGGDGHCRILMKPFLDVNGSFDSLTLERRYSHSVQLQSTFCTNLVFFEKGLLKKLKLVLYMPLLCLWGSRRNCLECGWSEQLTIWALHGLQLLGFLWK